MFCLQRPQIFIWGFCFKQKKFVFLFKIKNMSEKNVIISIAETSEGLEVRINEEAYDNLAIVGLLEKIKISLVNTNKLMKVDSKLTSLKKYDA